MYAYLPYQRRQTETWRDRQRHEVTYRDMKRNDWLFMGSWCGIRCGEGGEGDTCCRNQREEVTKSVEKVGHHIYADFSLARGSLKVLCVGRIEILWMSHKMIADFGLNSCILFLLSRIVIKAVNFKRYFLLMLLHPALSDSWIQHIGN